MECKSLEKLREKVASQIERIQIERWGESAVRLYIEKVVSENRESRIVY